MVPKGHLPAFFLHTFTMFVFQMSLYFSSLNLFADEKLYTFEITFWNCTCVSISLSLFSFSVSVRYLQGTCSRIICQTRALGLLHFFKVYLYTFGRRCGVKVKRNDLLLAYCRNVTVLLNNWITLWRLKWENNNNI